MSKKDQKRNLSTALRHLVAKNVMALRESSDMVRTQNELGRAAKIGQRTVSHLENGDSAANLDTIEAIATAFRLEAWQILVQGLNPARLPE